MDKKILNLLPNNRKINTLSINDSQDICINCGSLKLITNNDELTVCGKCFCVVKDIPVLNNRINLLWNYNYFSSSKIFMKNYNKYSKHKKLHNRENHKSKTSYKNNIYYKEILKKLNINNDEIANKATAIFDILINITSSRKKNRKGIKAMVLKLVLKDHRFDINDKKLAKICDIDKKTISIGQKLINKLLHKNNNNEIQKLFPIDPLSITDYLWSIKQYFKSINELHIKRLEIFLKRMENTYISVPNTTKSIVCGIFMNYVIFYELNITKKEIMKKFNISESSINGYIYETKPFIYHLYIDL
jgi:hypothetical protein